MDYICRLINNKHNNDSIPINTISIIGLIPAVPLFKGAASIAFHKANNIDLSNNAIIDIYQDAHGYIWLGTYDGLNLYNGKNTYVYRFEPDNKIHFAAILFIRFREVEENICGFRPRWD